MKIIRLAHEDAQTITSGEQTFWRLFDDKDLALDDDIELVDMVDAADKASWIIIGTATIIKIVEVKLANAQETDPATYAIYGNDERMIEQLRRRYGDKVTLQTAVKIVTVNFTPQSAAFQVVAKPAPTSAYEIKLFTDGGSRGNPGPSAGGFVLLDMNDRTLVNEGAYFGVTTNNQAEYLALRLGLERAFELRARVVHVYMDSMLVVNQMKGIYKIKNRDLWAVHQAIVDLLPRFEHVYFTHVPREYNQLADAAVNRALDEATSSEPL